MITDQAFILHKRLFQDSSEILKVLTKNNGIIDAVGKGSRRPKSKLAGQLQPFIESAMTFTGKSSLKTVTGSEQIGVLPNMPYINHVSMLYCNELMLLLNLDVDSTQSLYAIYKKTIAALIQSKQVSLALRNFEWRICCQQGYQLEISAAMSPTDLIEFNPESGLSRSKNPRSCSVQSLVTFIAGEKLNNQQIKEVSRLMKSVVNHLVHGKTIQSRTLLR